jgi:hypothetical protein
VYDQDGNAVALIAEELSGIGNEIQRQLLRTRRSFKSTVLSADGEAAAPCVCLWVGICCCQSFGCAGCWGG